MREITITLDASGNPVTATVPTTVETVVVTDASGSTVTGKFLKSSFTLIIIN